MRRLVILAAVALVLVSMVPAVAYGGNKYHDGYGFTDKYGGQMRASFQSTAHGWSSWWWNYDEFSGMSVGHWAAGSSPQASADYIQIEDMWQFNGLAISVSVGASGSNPSFGGTFSASGSQAFWTGTAAGPIQIVSHTFSGVRCQSRFVITSEGETCTATAYFASTGGWVTATAHG